MISVVYSTTLEIRGLSSDKKPVEKIPNGSVFFEMDTGKVFMFDEKNKKWIQL